MVELLQCMYVCMIQLKYELDRSRGQKGKEETNIIQHQEGLIHVYRSKLNSLLAHSFCSFTAAVAIATE